MGVVIRYATGTIHVACYKYLQGQYLVEEVKALAMERGLILAKEHKLSQIILKSDALTAINSVIAAETNGCLGYVYQGILSLLSSFSSWKIKHVKRDYNRAAQLFWSVLVDNFTNRNFRFRLAKHKKIDRTEPMTPLIYSLQYNHFFRILKHKYICR